MNLLLKIIKIKNKILENEIETLKQQINSLLDTNNIKDKLISQVQILSDDKKKLISEINELKQEISDKNKDKHLLELTIEKLWSDDLDNLEEELTKYEEKEEEDRLLAKKLNKGKSGAIPKRVFQKKQKSITKRY